MKIKNFFSRSLYLGLLLITIFSCSTEDVLPILVEVDTSETSLPEENGAITVTATINGAAADEIMIPLVIQGTATTNVDYTISSTKMVINKGESSGQITINSIQDEDVEGIETIELSLGTTSNVIINSAYNINISLIDDDTFVDSDNDGFIDAEDDCPQTPGAFNGCPFSLIINEILYDPASGSAGDANGDGTRDANEDEFIEFYNNSGTALDISGYTISDRAEVRHTFPQGTVIPNNGVLVLFGGGTPTGNFGGAIVQTASEGQINMTNSGDVVSLKNTNGEDLLTFDIEPLSGNPDESYTRYPDLTGDFVQHGADVPEANGALFSPGTKVDGSLF
ncbi:lamin tail domain-containing protein [Tenacibaculum sp. IB213877]|uniref:lamin tail domain-containing protein n=1 Tax=Tenacibaculum sp. IB213877 TaxID=3097351 RepID=UPI002A5987BA|nr:lamin tail domain-containing protein [Tenacibaculum sp. IB213877]MDY0781425.1 lamin tail domain-containing protein [Tenacibaculum sp. IB213877]